MKNNKKGLSELFTSFIMFGFIVAGFIFAFLLIKNLYLQDIIPPYEQAALDVLADHGNDTATYNTITAQRQNMESWDLNIDLLFFIFWILITIVMFVAAYNLPPVSTYNLLSISFIGLFIVGLLVNFVQQIFEWFVTEFIINIFTATEVNLPIFTFFLDNYFIIAIVTIIFILYINQFSKTPKGETVLNEPTSFGPVDQGGEEQ